MFRFLVVLIILLASTQARAQTACTYIVYGAVLTAAEWNSCFQNKQDVLVGGSILTGVTIVNSPSISAVGKISSNLSAGNLPAPEDSTVFLQAAGADGTDLRIQTTTYGNTSIWNPERYDGTQASPTALIAGDQIVYVASMGGYDGVALIKNATGRIIGQVGYGNWSGTSHPTAWKFQTTPVGSTTAVNNLLVDSQSHENWSGSTVTVASGAGDCGTSPVIVGNDVAGRITVGSSTNGGQCTVSFGSTWQASANAPVCSAQDETTSVLITPQPTTTAVVLKGSIVAGDSISYRCTGFY